MNFFCVCRLPLIQKYSLTSFYLQLFSMPVISWKGFVNFFCILYLYCLTKHFICRFKSLIIDILVSADPHRRPQCHYCTFYSFMLLIFYIWVCYWTVAHHVFLCLWDWLVWPILLNKLMGNAFLPWWLHNLRNYHCSWMPQGHVKVIKCIKVSSPNWWVGIIFKLLQELHTSSACLSCSVVDEVI